MRPLITYRTRQRLSHIARGFRYAIGRTTKADAEAMLYECSSIAGSYCLSSFSANDVLELALEEYESSDALVEVCENAAARVWHEWSDTRETASAAIDWAIDLVRERAGERGLSGRPTDEEATAFAEARA